MKLAWVRHGMTDWNQLRKIQGQTDIPLNAQGEAQAQQLARRLVQEAEQWDGVISSDMLRARRTAEIIAKALGVPQLPDDPRLRERAFGEIEGTTEAQRLERWGEVMPLKAAGAESDAAVRARGFAFIEELLARQPHASLLVVSHGSFLAQMLHALCEGLDDSYIGNMSLSIVQYREGKWHSLLHNCAKHL